MYVDIYIYTIYAYQSDGTCDVDVDFFGPEWGLLGISPFYGVDTRYGYQGLSKNWVYDKILILMVKTMINNRTLQYRMDENLGGIPQLQRNPHQKWIEMGNFLGNSELKFWDVTIKSFG